MKEPFRNAEQHAGVWCLALTAAPGINQTRVEVAELGAVILAADGEGGWWAVAECCQRCGNPMVAGETPQAAPGVVTCVTCTACGAEHSPQVDGCVCIGTLVVDDEVYLLRGT